MCIVLLISMTLTLMQDHSGSAEENVKCWMMSDKPRPLFVGPSRHNSRRAICADHCSRARPCASVYRLELPCALETNVRGCSEFAYCRFLLLLANGCLRVVLSWKQVFFGRSEGQGCFACGDVKMADGAAADAGADLATGIHAWIGFG